MRDDTVDYAGDACDATEAVAAILARGVLRLRQIDPTIAPESAANGLALCPDSRPSVVDGSESRRKEH